MSISRIFNGFPKAWKHYFIFLKRYLFRTFNNITSNCKIGTFFALLRASLSTAKKGTFLCLWWDRLKTTKRYLFRALNHRLHGKVRNGWKFRFRISERFRQFYFSRKRSTLLLEKSRKINYLHLFFIEQHAKSLPFLLMLVD